MRKFPLVALAAVLALGAGLAITGRQGSEPGSIRTSGAASHAPGTARQAAVASEPSAGSDEAWLAKLNATAWQDANRQTVLELSEALTRSESLREAVLQRYRSERDRVAKAALRMALAADPAPSVARKATAWAQDGNASEQADGLWLLAEIGPADHTAALARRALMAKGQGPELLMGALVALKPPEMPPPDEIPPVVARLKELSWHGDPLVRALSVQKMAEWDRLRHTVPGTIMRALGDADSQVRQSAAVAVDMAALRTVDIKTRLLELLGNRAEDPQVREAAAWVLDPFPLTRSEYEVYRRGRHDVVQWLNRSSNAGTQAQPQRP
jgi:hypothetical protein